MPPSMRGNKVTTVPAGSDLGSVLDAAIGDEPEPTPEAERLIEEARNGNVQIPGAAGGPPPGAAAADAGDGGGPGPDPVVPERDPDQTAATANALFWGAASGICDEWAPDDAAEYEKTRAALATYFKLRGTPPMPAEMILVGAFGEVAVKRAKRPKTGGWLARRFAGVPVVGKLLAPPPPPPEAPPSAPAAAAVAAAVPRNAPVVAGPFIRD